MAQPILSYKSLITSESIHYVRDKHNNGEAFFYFKEISKMKLSKDKTQLLSIPVLTLARISMSSPERVYHLAGIVNHLNPGLKWDWEKFFLKFEKARRDKMLFPDEYKARVLRSDILFRQLSEEEILDDPSLLPLEGLSEVLYDPSIQLPIIEQEGLREEDLLVEIKRKMDFFFNNIVLPDDIVF